MDTEIKNIKEYNMEDCENIIDSIVKKFRNKNLPMNKSSVRRWAILYVAEKIGMHDFSAFIDAKKRVKVTLEDTDLI